METIYCKWFISGKCSDVSRLDIKAWFYPPTCVRISSGYFRFRSSTLAGTFWNYCNVMDFQKKLYEIDQSLDTEEVKALCFLCADLLIKNLSQVERATELFDCLSQHGHLTEERPHLLTELLLTIDRPLLVNKYQLPRHSDEISKFRKLLYNLDKNLTDEHLDDIKFLLFETLQERKRKKAAEAEGKRSRLREYTPLFGRAASSPQKKLQKQNVPCLCAFGGRVHLPQTTLELFHEMENSCLLSENNLSVLEKIFTSVYPALNQQIAQFKETQVTYTEPVAEERGYKENRDSGVFSQQAIIQAPVAPPNGPQEIEEHDKLCEKLAELSTEVAQNYSEVM